MNELSTKNKTWVISTFQKNNYFITGKQYELIKNLGINERIVLDEGIINTNVIAEITTLEKFYINNPEFRPHYNNYDNKSLVDRVVYKSKDKNSALKNLIIGIKKHINSVNYKGTAGTKILLKKMELKLKQNVNN